LDDINGVGTIAAKETAFAEMFPRASVNFTQLLAPADGVAFGQTEFGPALQIYGTTLVQMTATNPGAGWSAFAVRRSGLNFEILWRNSDGRTFGSWLVDASGAVRSARTFGLETLLQIEVSYGEDFDDDGHIGLVFASSGVTIGTVELGTTQLGYALRVSGGSPIHVTVSGGYASPSQPGGGWVAIGARAKGPGFEMFWKNGSGQYQLWALNSTGARTKVTALSVTAFRKTEKSIGRDLDGDGRIG
jgi:hypothetical protein